VEHGYQAKPYINMEIKDNNGVDEWWVESKGLYEYVNLLTPPKQMPAQVSYRLLLELSKIFKEDRVSRINKKLID